MSDQPSFSKVPHWVLRLVATGALSPGALLVFAAVAKYVNYQTGRGGWPSVRTLENETGLAERTIRRHLTELEKHGCIVRVSRLADRGRQTSNIIEVVWEQGDAGPEAAPDVNPQPVDNPVENPVGETVEGLKSHDGFGQNWHPLNESTYSSSSYTSSFVGGGVAGFEGESSSAHPQTREGSPPDDGLGLQQQHKPEANATNEVSPPELPDVAVRLLRDRLNVTSPGSWPTVWNVAYSAFANTRVAHDLSPSEHLVSYLARCADEPSVPRPHVWLRWYVEDRAKHLTTLDAITVAGQHEDPQEREDRFNRRLPPDWDSPPTTTTTTEGGSAP